MKVEEFAREYLEQLKEGMDNLSLKKIESLVNILYQTYQKEKQVFIMGNGGSAATASHFALGLAKNTIVSGKKRFRVISLVDNLPLITAWSNDAAYEEVFVEQLKGLLQKGDVVIAISCSGNSKNILKAIGYANSSSAITIGLTGFDGGRLKDLAKECLIVSSNHMGRIEDIHLALTHLMESYLRERIANAGSISRS